MTLEPFSERWLEPFRASPFSLRFQLGGETFGTHVPVPRFTQAFGRARRIADEIFAASKQLSGVVAALPDSAADSFAPARDGFEAVAAAGFTQQPLNEWKAPIWPDQPEEEDQVPAHWRAYDLTGDAVQRDVLLWCAVSYEMAIAPKAPVLSFLADLDRNIVLHVYDDRGMDVTALDRETLLPLYRDRGEWLLDHDRKRMREAFGDA